VTVRLIASGPANGLVLIDNHEAGRYWENGAIAKLPGCQKIADLIEAVQLLRKLTEARNGD